MKTSFFILIFIICLVGCSSLNSENTLNYKNDLKNLFESIREKGVSSQNSKDNFTMRRLGIDKIEIKYNTNHTEMIEADSIVIFHKFERVPFYHERIIYDFADLPQNFGDEEIITASYKRVQLNERWYFEEFGFD